MVVGDEGDWAGDAVVELYRPLEAPLVRTDIKSAEMVKLASNAFLATKISFINEIANVCEETGADVVEVARGMGLDNRIGPKFLQAGIGFGGSCFPKDVTALKQLAGNSGYHFQLLNSVIEVNELQKRRVIAKLEKHLGKLVDKEIALLGLAFKPNTDDMREASSLVLSSRLQAAGAHVRAYDPVAEGEARKLIRGVAFKESAADAVDGADAVVLVTEWPEFAELDLAAVAEPRCAATCSSTVATCSTRSACVRPGCSTKGSDGPRGARRTSSRPEAYVQALILAGGEGTRLRPLTSTVPKPVVQLVDRPFIAFMLDWLRSHGVDDVVMSCGHMASGVRSVLGDGESVGLRLRYLEEPRPLGTGGALKFAEDMLDEQFLMLNGDVLTDIDVTAQLAAHAASGARATLALYPVEDPSAYGLVRLNEDGSVREFVEKPAPDQIDTNNISAGVYVLERSVLSLLARGEPASIERDVFPRAGRRRPLRPRRARLLEGHRDARALPRGDLRHPRGVGLDRGRRAHGRGLRVRRGRRLGRRPDRARPRSSRPAAGSATARGSAAGRSSQHGVSGRRGHDDRERGRDARRVDRRQLHAARLHRRRRRADRRPLRDRRDERDRRGRRRSARTTSSPTGPGCSRA